MQITKMNPHLPIIFTIAIISSISGANNCYQCISLDCNGDLDECRDVRSFIIDHLTKSYDIKSSVEDCPKLNDLTGWTLHQVAADPCPEKDSVCALERVKVQTHGDSRQANSFKSQASVMGCASFSNLKQRMVESNSHKCNITKNNGSYRYPELTHVMLTEHCSSPSTECKDKDWCVEPASSEISQFTTPSPDKSGSKLPVIIGIGVLCAVVFFAWGACHFCNLASYKTSYIPKSSLEETDSVIVVKTSKYPDQPKEYENAEQELTSKTDEEGITILS